MALTQQDLDAIRYIVNEAIDTRVPKIVGERIDERMPRIVEEIVDERLESRLDERLGDVEARLPKIIEDQVRPMLNRLEKRLTVKIEQLTLDVGQFSLETTSDFMVLEAHIGDLDDGLAKLYEMTDNKL